MAHVAGRRASGDPSHRQGSRSGPVATGSSPASPGPGAVTRAVTFHGELGWDTEFTGTPRSCSFSN